MNIAKNMEAIFVITIALIGATSVATAATPALLAGHHVSAATAPTAAPAQVVTIHAKRMTSAEKAQFDQE